MQENFMRRFAAILAGIVIFSIPAHAGGPEFVAGASYFDPTVKGVPLAGRRARLTTTQIRVT